jgi:hypothetical protein
MEGEEVELYSFATSAGSPPAPGEEPPVAIEQEVWRAPERDCRAQERDCTF